VKGLYADEAAIAFYRVLGKYRDGRIGQIDMLHKGEIFVLGYLVMNPGVSMPGELAQATRTSTARIAAILGNLEEKGQITREIDKADRRKIRVTVTESGRERARAVWQKAQEFFRDVFAQMGERDTAEFLRLFDRFLELSNERIGKPDDSKKRENRN